MNFEDRLEILDVVARYAFAFDDLDAATYASCFVDDAVLEIWFAGWDRPTQVIEGSAAIKQWAEDLFDGFAPGVHARQVPVSTVFDVLQADMARTRSFLIAVVHRASEQMPFVPTTGVYRDDWLRSEQGWRMSRRAIHHDRSEPARPY